MSDAYVVQAVGRTIRPLGETALMKTDLMPLPLGHGDVTADGRMEGCADLYEAVLRIGPRLHVFEHIHEAYGVS